MAGRDNTVIASYFAPQHNISQVACCGASGYLATGLTAGPSAGAGGGTSGIPAAGGGGGGGAIRLACAGGAGGAGGTGMSFRARAPRAGGGGGGGAPTGGAGGATGAIAPAGGAGGAGGGGGGAHLLLAPRQSGCSAACARLADSGRVMARPRARLDRMMRFMVFSLVGMKYIVRPQCGEIMEMLEGVYAPRKIPGSKLCSLRLLNGTKLHANR